MNIIIGSSRHDENGNYKCGKAGDQLQVSSTNDTRGEVSTQNFYVHYKGWYILRAKDVDVARLLASAMKTATLNKNIGYSQTVSRVKPVDVKTKTPINCDCSMLVRGCIYYACGKDTGNFTTANEVPKILATGLFTKHTFVSLSKTPLYNGDILVTKTKGHTVIVVDGNPRPTPKNYYPKYVGSSISIVTALKKVGERDTSFVNRSNIAKANGITNYRGTATQNLTLLKLLKSGKLIRV